MKTLLASMVLFLAAGCGTVNKQDVCKAAEAAYTAYLVYARAQEASGQPIDPHQVAIANSAAATLQLYCRWKQPSLPKNLSRIPERDVVDHNGAVVVRPQK